MLVARRVERDGSFYAGPFMPATFARKTMSLTHRLFGIRSCNEVITGKRERPCLEYDIKRCIAPCVDIVCSTERVRPRGGADAGCFSKARTTSSSKTLKTRMLDAAASERFEDAAQLRDAIRTVQTLHDRQQKMATPELGHRDVFGMKLGPAGVVVQVFQVRSGRVVERIELGAKHAVGRSGRRREVLEAAMQQFYELRGAPPEIHVPARAGRARCARELAVGARGRRVRIVVPQRGEKRGLVDLASRNAALGVPDALQPGDRRAVRRARDAAGGADAARRCRGASSASTSRRSRAARRSRRWSSATTAACAASEYRKFRIRGMPRAAGCQPRSRPLRRSGSAVNHDDFAAMHEVVLRRYRKLLEQGGPFPDLVAHRRRQRAAGGRLRRARGARARRISSPSASRRRKSCIYTRDREDPIALARERSGAAARAADSRRSASLRRHVSSARADAARPAVGARRRARHRARRRRALLTRFGSLAGVRRATTRGICERRSERNWPTRFLRFSQVGHNLNACWTSTSFAQVLLAFIVLLFSLTVHEAAHAWTADRLGDPTARLLGRVSLNPLVHADLIGTVALSAASRSITGAPLIGWAKPCPVDVRRLRHPRRDYMLVAAAGPASNLLLALVASMLAGRDLPVSPMTDRRTERLGTARVDVGPRAANQYLARRLQHDPDSAARRRERPGGPAASVRWRVASTAMRPYGFVLSCTR